MTPLTQCDQAIFTSVRGPMGEGYRIVAASRGLRPEEKQVITKLSPSHDALCWQPEEDGNGCAYAAAYYPLPTGRACVAYSCYAGAEHTGRGGHRVYTYNLIFNGEELTDCTFNPFHVLRGMVAAGLTVPQLSPSAVLDEVTVNVDDTLPAEHEPSVASVIEPGQARCALEALLNERPVIVPVPHHWLEVAEMLLLGLPGPMRAAVPFAAGLRFSLGRGHRINVLFDAKDVAKARIVGQSIEYIDGRSVTEPGRPASSWGIFFERQWARGDPVLLDSCTSLPFPDTGLPGLDKIGALYNAIDAVTEGSTLELLQSGLRHCAAPESGILEDIRKEFLALALEALLAKLASTSGPELAAL